MNLATLQELVLLPIDTDEDSPLSARLQSLHRLKAGQAPVASVQMPSGPSAGIAGGSSSSTRGSKRARAQQTSPEAVTPPSQRRRRQPQQQRQPARPAQDVVDLTEDSDEDEVIVVGSSGPSRRAPRPAARTAAGRAARQTAAAPGHLLSQGVPAGSLFTPVRAAAAVPALPAAPKTMECAGEDLGMRCALDLNLRSVEGNLQYAIMPSR